MDIRPARPGDIEAIHDVHRQAFGREQVAELVSALRGPPRSVSLLAETGGHVVGHVQLSRGWVDAASQLVDVLVLSPLGVPPEHQRHGIGASLVRAALREAERSGVGLRD